MTVVTLKSGLKVGNFSSPHEFIFDDGSVLAACSPERARAFSLQKETEVLPSDDRRFKLVRPKFNLHPAVRAEVERTAKTVDVLIVPFPMLESVAHVPNAVTCILADRVTKVVRSDEFGK